MPDEAIWVEGLAGLRKGLGEAQKGLPRALSAAHREVAEMVVAGARPLLVSKYGRQQAKVKIAASGTQRGAFVKLSGEAAMGSEFGSLAYTQFRGWRGSGQGAGYAVFPTIRAQRETVIDLYAAIVEREVLERAAQVED